MLKIVELNGGSSLTIENSSVNIILLDKILQHEQVMQYLIAMQLANINRSKPRQFLGATLDPDTLQMAVSKGFSDQYPNGGIQLVRKQMARILRTYKDEGHLNKFKALYEYFQNLEVIAEGFNNVISGQILKAQEVFERLKIIPMANDPAEKFFKDFEEFKNELKWLVLDVVSASSKCMYIDVMLILNNSQNGGLQYDTSLQTQKSRTVLTQRRAQISKLGIFMDSLLQNKSYKSADP